MENKIQTNATGQITPCFQHKINKTMVIGLWDHDEDSDNEPESVAIMDAVLHKQKVFK